MKLKITLIVMAFIGVCQLNAQGLPENPEPGKCYVKCITKDVFETVTERVLVEPEYSKLEVIPATYKTVDERVLIKEASKRMVYVPATYETVEVSYIEKQSTNKLNVIPAVFGNSSKTIETYPVTSGWEYKVLEDCPSVNKDDCVAACFVEYPSQSTNVSITTLATDAKTTSENIPQISASYKKQVIKTPARVDEIDIPAEYSVIKKRVVDVPASSRSVSVPAKYETVTKTVLKTKGGITTWEEVECELLDPTVLPIFYELGSARLTPDSKRVIDERLLPVLNEKPVNIEILSHTDSRGNDGFNQSLSQQRANSVVNYLVSKGVSRSRLAAKGYGESRLTNNCSNGVNCSESQHQRNRRTEFRIINN